MFDSIIRITKKPSFQPPSILPLFPFLVLPVMERTPPVQSRNRLNRQVPAPPPLPLPPATLVTFTVPLYLAPSTFRNPPVLTTLPWERLNLPQTSALESALHRESAVLPTLHQYPALSISRAPLPNLTVSISGRTPVLTIA